MDLKIMIVDDSKLDVVMIESILEAYQPLVAYDGQEAMDLLALNPDTDLMILDLNMPRKDGFQVLREIKQNPQYDKIITIILTNSDELDNEIKGLELGAIDYIRKPLNMESLNARINIHGKMKLISKQLEKTNENLEAMVAARTDELVLTRNITLNALSGLLEIRDIESSNHTLRTQHIILALCEQLLRCGFYTDQLTEAAIQEIFDTAPLHDIGKVGIPDAILLKPGRLTVDEYEIMKKHTTYGVDALEFQSKGKMKPDFIKRAIDIINTHHERFDGSGYPNGYKGQDIPLAGRLMAIADVYDALISKRVYKEAYPQKEALSMINAERGKHFDPVLVDALLAINDQLLEINARFNQA